MRDRAKSSGPAQQAMLSAGFAFGNPPIQNIGTKFLYTNVSMRVEERNKNGAKNCFLSSKFIREKRSRPKTLSFLVRPDLEGLITDREVKSGTVRLGT